MREFVARIWSDDYVPEVFDEWVRDRRGRLWVAIEDGRPVGIAKLTMLGEREAWLHALRVDPRYRRRGIATALLEHRLARARRLGARIARLDTSEDNAAIKRLTRRHGFRRVERINYYYALPKAIAPPRRARAREVDALWRLARGVLFHLDYMARRLTRADIARAARAGDCYAVGDVGKPAAFAIAERQWQSDWSGGSRLRVRVLAGAPRAVRQLASALRGQARQAGVERVGAAPPSQLWPIVRTAGYRRRWHDAMLVFEKRL